MLLYGMSMIYGVTGSLELATIATNIENDTDNPSTPPLPSPIPYICSGRSNPPVFGGGLSLPQQRREGECLSIGECSRNINAVCLTWLWTANWSGAAVLRQSR